MTYYHLYIIEPDGIRLENEFRTMQELDNYINEFNLSEGTYYIDKKHYLRIF